MNKIAKATVGLMIATILAKVLGFGRELVLASSYGASMYSDAYLTAMNIPIVIFASIGASITTTFIPIYYDINKNLGEERALKFTNNIFNISICICLLLTILGSIFTEPLVKIFAFGFKQKTFEIAVSFTRILMISIVFTGLSVIMTAYLQVKENFTIPGLVSVPRNIIIISSIFLSVKYGPYVMVWGSVLGVVSEFLFQFPFAIKKGYKYKLYISINDKYIKKAAFLICPVLIGIGVNQINVMIDRTLASTLVEGSISSLNYANKLNGFVMALFIVSIGTVIYPMLSKLSNENNREEFIQSVVKSINIVVLLVTPISVGAIVLSNPIVKILFERGAFDSKATYMTALALVMYSIGMLSVGLVDILGKVFYSLQDTKIPMINSAISMVMNIIFNLVLIKYLKHAGLALGTSLSSMVCTVLLFRSLKKKIGYFGQDKILKTIFKAIISSVVMGCTTYFSHNILLNILNVGFVHEIIALCGSIVTGIIVYLTLVILFKVEEVNVIIQIIKSKLSKKKVSTEVLNN